MMADQDKAVHRMMAEESFNGDGASAPATDRQHDRRLRVCLFSSMAMADTHGTGVQLRRIFQDSGADFVHFYLGSRYSGKSTVQYSYRLEDAAYWPWFAGRRTAHRLEQLLGLGWWNGTRLRSRRFNRLRSRIAKPDVAYVTVASNDEAARALSFLDSLRCPYIVHLWDNIHTDGLDPARYPDFAQLLRSAASVLALSEPLAEEARRGGARRVQQVCFAQDAHVPQANWTGSSPLRIAMIGTLYPRGIEILAEAARQLAASFPGLRIIYTGKHSSMLPNVAGDLIVDHGFIAEDQQYLQLLASCHLAYLPGPCANDAFSQFSIPSRIADYFMAGLPLLANVPPESATARFLSQVERQCIASAQTPQEFLAGAGRFTCSPVDWKLASVAARQFACSEMSVSGVRAKIFAALNDAAKRQLADP